MKRYGLARRCSVLLAVLALSFGPGGVFAKGKSLQIGTEAPDFTLSNLEGEEVCLYDVLKKGPVLLDFWALWCKPCLRALPATNELQDEFEERGLSVLTVNTDSPRSTAKVRPYVKSKGYTFEVLMDPNRTLERLYRFSRIPQVYLISTDRSIAYSQLGYSPPLEKRLHSEVVKLFQQDEAEETVEEE